MAGRFEVMTWLAGWRLWPSWQVGGDCIAWRLEVSGSRLPAGRVLFYCYVTSSVLHTPSLVWSTLTLYDSASLTFPSSIFIPK